ncbi:carbohydrate kinase [Chelativorans sp. ZYF759]|uniref:carbohydrate kinase family protein n=1 Tax=Chelativorans sp. ZYF759 TaxID=2692213 RepID=UPI00145D050B|nr:carbohydrate kinase family protein [Chelativorans sp. ZYF759]NMG39933.1 carbohydrate kinase [Chelativorans sp. ZYF759]
MSPTVLGVGGAHVDRRGRAAVAFVPGASNPGTMREEAGGGTLNALRAVRREGIKAALASVRGGDAAGETVARALAEAGIEDRSAVFLDRATPSYTAILDEAGDVVAALADMGLYEAAFERQLRRKGVREFVAGADCILTDANLTEAAIARLIMAAGTRPVHAIAISPAKAGRLKPHLGRLACLFMNAREAEVLSGAGDAHGAARALRGAGLASGVITQGGGPVIGFDRETLFDITPPPPDLILDVTGAGDALAGTTIARLIRGEPFAAALRAGIAAATLTVESEGAAPAFDRVALEARLLLVPEPVPVP